MNSIIALLSLTLIPLSSAQLFLPHLATASAPSYNYIPQSHLYLTPPELVRQPRDQQQYPHPSVVENALRESELAPEQQKSHRFYSNPRIAAALARESWFTSQEMPVLDREAEKIPRDMIYKLIRNAGFIRRR